MKLCDFCRLQQGAGVCAAGHSIPQKMKCVGFTPGLERFCANDTDYTGRDQLKQMAEYFGLTGKELKRVLALSENADN